MKKGVCLAFQILCFLESSFKPFPSISGMMIHMIHSAISKVEPDDMSGWHQASQSLHVLSCQSAALILNLKKNQRRPWQKTQISSRRADFVLLWLQLVWSFSGTLGVLARPTSICLCKFTTNHSLTRLDIQTDLSRHFRKLPSWNQLIVSSSCCLQDQDLE